MKKKKTSKPKSQDKSSAFDRVEKLLVGQPHSLKTWHIAEPELEFGSGGRGVDPKSGLALYGPWGNQDETAINKIKLGIIGTGDTISLATNWLSRCRQMVHPGDSSVDPILFPSFPGMEEKAGFNCQLEFPQRLQEVLTPAELARCAKATEHDVAVDATVQVVRERLNALKDKDSPPDVVLIALPDEIRESAGAGRGPARKKKAKPEIPNQLSFLDLPPPSAGKPSKTKTLHRHIKAEGMRAGLPTQLAWPGTFSGSSVKQDDATRAWNFCNALYYKAGGIPWRVVGLDRGTCYIGITFYRPQGQSSMLQTSMAQAFSDRGDGLVLRGESFEWDIQAQGEPHLSQESAKKLVGSVVQEYFRHVRQKPARVVIHKSSGFSQGELSGMTEALSEIPHYDFLSIGRSAVRFLRMGKEPPLRGTAIEISPKRYTFYTGGYVPFLRVYPGLRIPCPLSVVHWAGSGSVPQILGEILALTKSNWNSATFASATPITVDFSNNVGLILSELPPDVDPKTQYRFYM